MNISTMFGFSKKSGLAPSMSYREAFKVLDKDGDGRISSYELKSVLTKNGQTISEVDVQLLIEQCDANGDGELQIDEFETFWKAFQAGHKEKANRDDPEKRQGEGSGSFSKRTTASRMRSVFTSLFSQPATQVTASMTAREVFNVFDADGSGSVSVQELKQLLGLGSVGSPLGTGEVEAIVALVDSDGNGSLDVDEVMLACHAPHTPRNAHAALAVRRVSPWRRWPRSWIDWPCKLAWTVLLTVESRPL